MLADTFFDWLFYRGQGDEALSLRSRALSRLSAGRKGGIYAHVLQISEVGLSLAFIFFPFLSISSAASRIPKSNSLENFRENVTLCLATSLSYVMAGTHSLFLSFNPHSWPQADIQRGH